MINKLLKIFILLYFFTAHLCFSQINHTAAKSESVLSQYNHYLTAVKLNKLIKATGFAYENNIKHGFLNQVSLTGVYVLTIEPDSAYSDPITFASTWGSVLATFDKETDAYGQLFFKLADYTQLPPDSLVILIKTSSPDVFSYLVYFDKGIKISELVSKARGGPKTTVDITADDLNNDMYEYVFQKVAYTNKIKEDLIKGICDFLKSNENGEIDQTIQIKPVYRAPDILFFEARNLHGRVTKKDFEDITINLNISRWPVDDKKGAKSSTADTASIQYTLNVFYSAKKFSGPANAENALNAVTSFKYEMGKYGDKLFHVFDNIVHENY